MHMHRNMTSTTSTTATTAHSAATKCERNGVSRKNQFPKYATLTTCF